jgi:uncharacterized protein (DUF1015 family)
VADVQPFQAVRYAHPTPALVAPPYDVVSPEERERLLARDPHNVAHLTLAADETSAGDVYRAWLDGGVLVQEDRSALWVWEQRFTAGDGGDRRRLGVVASLRVEPYEHQVVLPHERTHAGPIESRLRLLRSVNAQLEPLFFLYDGEPPVGRPERKPDLEAQGTRLWRLDDDRGVADFFAERQVLIADGHHRYETALAYAAEQGDTDPRLLAVLVSSDDPGLEILATHRVFSGRPDLRPEGEQLPSVAAGLEALAAAPPDRSAALVYRHGVATLVRGASGELDVELVERAGLEGISYTVDAAEAVALVDAGGADCAYLIRRTPIHDLFDRARAGRVMPPKATHFYPKLTSGLLFHPLGVS